ncbi:MAG: hypothetical protein JW740_03215 [Candidatus Zambryskibacteria bacterium]|nr:hypothetical protein [Candidatus Zambryskibacteria bacterium]
MRGIKRKDNKWKKALIFLVLLAILGVLTNSVRKVYLKKQDAEKALVRMEKELDELQNRKIFLQTSLDKLSTEEGMAFEIRKKFNVAEVGESVAIIVEERNSENSVQPQISTWQKIKDFMLNLFH